MFSHFNTVPDCDRRTDGRAELSYISRLHAMHHAVKIHRFGRKVFFNRGKVDEPINGKLWYYCAICFNPLDPKDNCRATWINTKLVHWPLMGELLHLVQRGGAWAGCGPAPVKSPFRYSKYNSPPINGQCTNHRIAI